MVLVEAVDPLRFRLRRLPQLAGEGDGAVVVRPHHAVAAAVAEQQVVIDTRRQLAREQRLHESPLRLHVVPGRYHRRRVLDAQLGGRFAAPGRRQRDEQLDGRHLRAAVEEEIAHHQPAHAVRRDIELLEAVLQLQVEQLPHEQVRHGVDGGAGGIVEKPRLVAAAIDVVEEVAPILRRAAGAVHEQDGNLARVVGFEEVDVAAHLAEELHRRPIALAAVFGREQRIVEVGDGARLGAVRGLGAAGVKLGARRDRQAGGGLFQDDVEIGDDTRAGGDDRLRAEVFAGRLAGVEGEIAVAVAEGEQPVAAAVGHRQLEAAGLVQPGAVRQRDAAEALRVGGDDDGSVPAGRCADAADEDGRGERRLRLLPQLDEGAGAEGGAQCDERDEAERPQGCERGGSASAPGIAARGCPAIQFCPGGMPFGNSSSA